MMATGGRAAGGSPPLRLAPGLRGLIVLVVCVAIIAYVLAQAPIPQDPEYHRFADQRTILGVGNGLNVLSNIPFLLLGIVGCWVLVARASRSELEAWLVLPYLTVFLGMVLTTFGSAYYHLAPDNQRLVWDRLPMTLMFMGLLSAVIGERVGRRPMQMLFSPLLVAGLGSVVYWIATEELGRGDLRPYLLVQYGSLALIVLLLFLYPARYSKTAYLWATLAAYAAAKVFEIVDHQAFAIGHVISGHTLKHLAAAGGVACIVRMLHVRVPLAPRQNVTPKVEGDPSRAGQPPQDPGVHRTGAVPN